MQVRQFHLFKQLQLKAHSSEIFTFQSFFVGNGTKHASVCLHYVPGQGTILTCGPQLLYRFPSPLPSTIEAVSGLVIKFIFLVTRFM